VTNGGLEGQRQRIVYAGELYIPRNVKRLFWYTAGPGPGVETVQQIHTHTHGQIDIPRHTLQRHTETLYFSLP